MRSTGEVLGVGRNIEEALYKGFVGAKMILKRKREKYLQQLINMIKKNSYHMAKNFS